MPILLKSEILLALQTCGSTAEAITSKSKIGKAKEVWHVEFFLQKNNRNGSGNDSRRFFLDLDLYGVNYIIID